MAMSARAFDGDPRHAYELMTDYLTTYFDEVEPREFYRTIFPAGELERKGERTGKYTAIVIGVTGRKKWIGGKWKSEIKRYSLTDDLDVVDVVCDSDDFCLCSPLSYAGKTRTADHARFAYAVAVDVDHLRIDQDDDSPIGLRNLWERHIEALERVPKPTFIVSSGSGLHLYYVLERPIPLFADTVFELQEYKRELTRLIWHDTIVDIKSVHDIQQEGIYQGFRMPGTVTKYGDRAVAFRTGDRVSMEYLNTFVRDMYKVKHYTYKHSMTRAEAAEKYPDWYKWKIENKGKRGSWAVNRALYDWWLERIKTGATVGHRYYCMMTLAMYARKCSQYDEKHNPNPVTREELERDCFSLVELFDEMTIDDKNHFDTDDVIDALEAYDDQWITYPRRAIEYRSGIAIPENKRNGRKQKDHIQLMNFVRDQLNHNTTWNRIGNGRKSKRDQVIDWQLRHPDGSKSDCVHDTGISRATVYRHWVDNLGPGAAADSFKTDER